MTELLDIFHLNYSSNSKEKVFNQKYVQQNLDY